VGPTILQGGKEINFEKKESMISAMKEKEKDSHWGGKKKWPRGTGVGKFKWNWRKTYEGGGFFVGGKENPYE